MNTVPAKLHILHHLCFIVQPFLPSFSHSFFVDIILRHIDEKMIMSRLTFHKTTVKLPEVIIVEALAQSFKSFAASRFDQGHCQELVQKTFFFIASFFLELQELIHVFVLSLFTQGQSPFPQFREHLPEMTPFLGHDRRELIDEPFPQRIALDQGNATRCSFLFTVGMIGKNVFQGDGRQVHPARVGW